MKNYYYVGVTTNSIDDASLRYVYKTDGATKTAYWGTYKQLREKGEKPKKFTLTQAKNLAFCLRANFYDAFVITTTIDYE